MYLLNTPLCGKVCQWLAEGRCFSPVSSTNKADRHDIADILLEVALNTITLILTYPNGTVHFSNSVAKSPESYTIKTVIESTYIDS